MAVRPEYILSCTEDSPYYGSMRSMAQLLQRLGGDAPQTVPLPDGWLIRRWGGWEGWTPREWTPRVQGWKIHVSTVPAEASETLALTTRICVAHQVAFKFLPDPSSLQDTNGKQHDRGGSGKFITIYPADDDQLAVLLDELEVALAGRHGPYILSDLRYGEAPVFVRYGGIMSFSYPDALDRQVNAVTGPGLNLVKDERRPRFIIPEGVELPACLEVAHRRSRTSSPSRLQEFKAVSPLHFSNAGGVYKATLPDGTVHVLREARSHTGLDARGRDAVTRQREEQVVLGDLAGLAGVQQLLGSFWAWEHRYLELEYAPGRSLTSWVVQNAPFDAAAEPGQAQRYAERMVHIGEQLITIIDDIHARGWAVGDLHPGNVLIDDDDRVTVIDFEDATRVDSPRAIGLRVFEFCGPEQLDAVQSDWYAISRSLMLSYVPDWEIEVIAPGFWDAALQRVERDFGQASADQLRRVLARFPAVPSHLLTPQVTVEPWPGGTTPDEVIAALDAGIEWSRGYSPGGGFPGDPAKEGDVTESLGFGRAGVVFARSRIGRANDSADLDALAAAGSGSVTDPGLYTGRAGIALALALAGRHEQAAQAAWSALEESLGRRRLDLFGGRAGVLLAALQVAAAAGDADLTRAALEANERLQRSVRPDTGPWDDLTHRRGLHFGLTGLALTDLAAELAGGDQAPAQRAVQRLRADLDACLTTSTGELMVRDTDNNRALPYLEWGSAGIWAVALAAERLTGRALLSDIEHRALVKTCSSDLYIYGTLDHGRAGIMAALAASGPGQAAEVDRQRGLLLRNLLTRDGMLFTVGDGMIRLSSDLSTGAAGIAVALHAAGSGRVFDWLPLGAETAGRLSTLPLPQRGELPAPSLTDPVTAIPVPA